MGQTHAANNRLKSVARMIFGVIWAIDAGFKWLPAFRSEYLKMVEQAAQGQPSWLQPWFHFWIHLIGPRVQLFWVCTALVESYIAVALILGFARKATYWLTLVFSLSIWSTAEGFGGPYTAGATDIGTGIIYALAALFLLALNATAGTSRYSVDALLEQRIPWWPRVAEMGPGRPRKPEASSSPAVG